MNPFEITNCPSTLTTGYNSYSYTALRRMFDNRTVSHILDKNISKNINENICSVSIPGSNKKITAKIKNGKIVPAEKGEQGKYIVKFAPSKASFPNSSQLPANEHLTMQIARQVFKIDTAENGLIFLHDGQPAYITKRFDFNESGEKVLQEDFASFMIKTPETHGASYKNIGSYAGIGTIFKIAFPAWQVEVYKFYKLLVFNYMFGNANAHLKNLSVYQTKYGDFILTPAYGLINTALHNNSNDFALDDGLFHKTFFSKTYKRKGHPCIDDFITLGKMIELPDIVIDKVNEEFIHENEEVYSLIERSFLDKKMKKKYIQVYQQRLKRFVK